MKSRTTERFRVALERLPAQVRQQARTAYRRFCEDPAHPSLHFKQVHSTLPVYSVRVGIHYRAVGMIDGDTIVWFWVGPHADYEALLTRL